MERRFLAAPAALLVLCACALGGYTLSPMVDGKNSAVVGVNYSPTVTIFLALSSDAQLPDEHTSAIFSLAFSRPGLQCQWHGWGQPYGSGGIDDFACPSIASLPALIQADTWVAPISDPGAADLYFENFLSDQSVYSTGTIAAVTITVPQGFPYGLVTITPVPEAFDNGLASIPTTGEPFTLEVVPAGDLNGDGFVGQADLNIVLAAWGETVPPGNPKADLTGDGFVGQADLNVVLACWGNSSNP